MIARRENRKKEQKETQTNRNCAAQTLSGVVKEGNAEWMACGKIPKKRKGKVPLQRQSHQEGREKIESWSVEMGKGADRGEGPERLPNTRKPEKKKFPNKKQREGAHCQAVGGESPWVQLIKAGNAPSHVRQSNDGGFMKKPLEGNMLIVAQTEERSYAQAFQRGTRRKRKVGSRKGNLNLSGRGKTRGWNNQSAKMCLQSSHTRYFKLLGWARKGWSVTLSGEAGN